MLRWGRYTFKSDFEEKKSDNENPIYPTIEYNNIADYIEEAKCIDNLNISVNNENVSSELSDDINDGRLRNLKLNWLNKFYKWIESSNITTLSSKKIVPNRLGEFCSTEPGCELKDASDIPTDIFDFMKKSTRRGLVYFRYIFLLFVLHFHLDSYM